MIRKRLFLGTLFLVVARKEILTQLAAIYILSLVHRTYFYYNKKWYQFLSVTKMVSASRFPNCVTRKQKSELFCFARFLVWSQRLGSNQ